MSRITSHGRCTRSMGAKEVCILLVNDDHICCNIVAEMLQHVCYEVFSYEREMDSLNMICERKDKLELVLTNVHRTDANRFGIIEHIEKELKLQIILMSPQVENSENVSRGAGSGAAVYFMKSLSISEINSLWANALAREKDKRELSSENLGQGIENASPSVVSQGVEDCDLRKRKRETSEQDGGSKDESNVEKKPRVVWTKDMHQKFLDAIAQLGHDKAFPKKIVEIMNVPGLTRENVASHLQKYRLCMKRAQEGYTGASYGLNLSYDFNGPFGFNTSLGNSRQSTWNKFPLGSRGTNLSILNSNHYGFSWEGSRFRPPHSTLSNYHRNNLFSYTPRNILSSNAALIDNKLEHNFRIYRDDTKNILSSIDNNRASLNNTSFIGFRLAGDGRTVEFGQKGHLGDSGIRSVNENHIQCPSVPSVGFNSSYCSLLPFSFTRPQQLSFTAPPGPDQEKSVSFSPQQQCSAALPGTECADQDKLVSFTPQQQCSTAHLGTDWDELANFAPAHQQSSIDPLEADQDKLAGFTPLQQCSAALPGIDWKKSGGFTPHQQSSIPPLGADQENSASFTPQLQISVSPLGNNVNDNSEIFNNFTSLDQPSPPPLCELESFGMGSEHDGIDVIEKSARSFLDEEDFNGLLFDYQHLTS